MYKLLKLAFISLLMLCFSACQKEDQSCRQNRKRQRKPSSSSCPTATTSTVFYMRISTT